MSGPYLSGPGGATPFIDLAGHLRLAYHAWRTGNVGYPATDACLTSSKGCAQRRMYVATLVRHKKGRLGRLSVVVRARPFEKGPGSGPRGWLA